MIMKNTVSADNDMVKKVKLAIKTRKYAHADEINLLWQHALNTKTVISWKKIMSVSIIVSTIILIISTL
ncbi:3-oxoacyl-ACP synthase [Providencia vermicola]|uniref:3-oxoacyl-ACP synthase n=1 Tax=Providencia vermicola TaxID=333965 RepID=UPI001CEC2B5A|nr:3-oxoacyl-ACP synthase [Providencia vermicola]